MNDKYDSKKMRREIEHTGYAAEGINREVRSQQSGADTDKYQIPDVDGIENMYEEIMKTSPLQNSAAKSALAHTLVATLQGLREVREKMLRGETDFEANRTIAPMASNVKRTLEALKMLNVKEDEDEL